MASGSNTKSPINGHDDVYKMPRHPRWTQQETLVLIEGKRIVEGRGRKGRRSSSVFGPENNVEPKWDAVSSHCKRNGVDRGPVQCRKRWSNLLSDFKKIKTWDSQELNIGGECFWAMRSDLRRERKLPGFFDREIYDVLDGRVFAENQLALVTISVEEDNGGDDEIDDGIESTESDENRDRLSSEFDQNSNLCKEKIKTNDKTNEFPSPVPISEIKFRAYDQAYSNEEHKRQSDPDFWRSSESQEGMKRRKKSCRNTDAEDTLLTAVERNNKLLNAHIEEKRLNWHLDREHKKEEHHTLMAALSKITDALEIIKNKL